MNQNDVREKKANVDLFGLLVFAFSTSAVLVSSYHFFINKDLLQTDELPLMSDLDGKIISRGPSTWFYAFPTAAWIAYFFFYWIINHPEIWTFPVSITSENKKAQYTQLRAFFLNLQIWFFVLLLWTQYHTELVARALRTGMPPYVNILFLISLIGICFKYFFDFSTNF